jgi:hypothetical protein
VAPSSSVPWQRTGPVGRRAPRLPPTAYTFHHSSVYDQRLAYPSTADDYSSYSAYRLRKTKAAGTLAPPSIEPLFTPLPCPLSPSTVPSLPLPTSLPLATLPLVPVHWGWSAEDPVVRLVSMRSRYFSLAAAANDRRTASADGSSLTPSLPDSTSDEQPAAPFPYPCPALRPPIVRATCPTPTSALPALAASSYPIPARLPSPSPAPSLPLPASLSLATLPPVHAHWGWSAVDPVVRLVSMRSRYFSLAAAANDRRTASADGSAKRPSPMVMIRSQGITSVEQPAVPFPYPCPALCPPIVRATCPTPASALPTLAASSYPIPARLPSPSHSTPGSHASRSHKYIHACPTHLSPFHTHHAVHYTLSSAMAAAPSTTPPEPCRAAPRRAAPRRAAPRRAAPQSRHVATRRDAARRDACATHVRRVRDACATRARRVCDAT